MDVLQIHSQLEFFSDQDDLKRQLQTCPKPVCVCKEKDSELSILSLNFIASSIHPIRSFIHPSIQSIPLSIHPSIHPILTSLSAQFAELKTEVAESTGVNSSVYVLTLILEL